MYGLCLTLWLYNTSPVDLNLTVGVCATAHQSFQLTELKIKFKDGGSSSYTDGKQTKVRKLNPKEKEVGKMASCCRGQESRKYNSMNRDIPNLYTHRVLNPSNVMSQSCRVAGCCPHSSLCGQYQTRCHLRIT